MNFKKKQFDYLRIPFFIFIFAPRNNKSGMEVTFNEDYLKRLYTDGETGIKKLRFQPQIVRGYQKAVKYLIHAKRKEDLFPFKSLHFEALHGDKEGRYSVKANDQYRVEFTLTETEDVPIVTICNIMELSNHYK
jgi:proteic killer suppression protein